jgi:hypothetical protein
MIPWLNPQDIDDDAEEGLLDFELPLDACSAQEMMAALLLQQRDPLTMGRMLEDLEEHSQLWHSFCSYPAFPTKPRPSQPGTLACLRDMGQGWTANVIYLLAVDQSAAITLSRLARQWPGAKITNSSLSQTRRLVGNHDQSRLLMVEWNYPRLAPPELEAIYHLDEPPDLIVEDRLLGRCSTQQLVVGLLLAASGADFYPPMILKDLQAHPQWWYSFLVGPRLIGRNRVQQPPLQVLQQLPDFWSNDCLYIWTRSDEAAKQFQTLSKSWLCEVEILKSPQASRWLDLPDAPPIVVMSWD